MCGFYSVNSWESGYAAWHLAEDDASSATLWVGEGFFTQTATLADERTEALTFYLPQYSTQNAGNANRRLARYYVADGIEDSTEDGDFNAELVSTEYYTTDGIRVNKPKHGMIIMREVYSNGATRSRKMYMK